MDPGLSPTRRNAFIRSLQVSIVQSVTTWCVNWGIAATTDGKDDGDCEDGDGDVAAPAPAAGGKLGVGCAGVTLEWRHLRHRVTFGLLWSVPHVSQTQSFGANAGDSVLSALSSVRSACTFFASWLSC